MTVSSIVVRAVAGWTGAETEFPTGIQLLAKDQLSVSLIPDEGERQTLTRGLHYAVTLSPAGVATVAPLAAFPAIPGEVSFVRRTPMTQDYDPSATDSYDAAGHAAALDRSAMRVAELSQAVADIEAASVVVKGGASSVPEGAVYVSDGAGKAIAGPTVTEIEAARAAAMSAADAATAAANTADSAAVQAGTSSGEAEHWAEVAQSLAAQLDINAYSTTAEIAAMLAGYALAARKLKAGKGLKLNGVAGTDAVPAEADLAADLLFGFDLSAFAAVQALWNAGADEGLHPISPAQLKAAIAALSTPATPDEYVSDEIAITLSSSVTLTHGLGVAPKIVELYLVCKASDQGYSVGDVVLIPSCAVYVGSGSVSGVQAATVGTTSIAISFCNYTTWMSPKTGGAANFISGIKWKLVVRARK